MIDFQHQLLLVIYPLPSQLLLSGSNIRAVIAIFLGTTISDREEYTDQEGTFWMITPRENFIVHQNDSLRVHRLTGINNNNINPFSAEELFDITTRVLLRQELVLIDRLVAEVN